MDADCRPAEANTAETLLNRLEKKVAALPDATRSGIQKELLCLHRRVQELEEKLAVQQEGYEEQTARFDAVLHALQVGVWITDERGSIVSKNEMADKIWRGTAPLVSVEKYPVYKAWFIDTGKRLEAQDYPVSKTLQSGEPQDPLELNIERFDGSKGVIMVSAAPIRDPMGRLIGSVSLNIDITERKHREQTAKFLTEIGTEFVHLTTPLEIIERVAEKIANHYALSGRLVFVELESNEDEFELIYDFPMDGVPGVRGRYRVSSFIDDGLRNEINTGKVQAIDDVTSDPRTAANADAFLAMWARSLLLAPFVPEGRSMFILVLTNVVPHTWQPHEIELAKALSELICRRLDTARVEEALRESENRFRIMADNSPSMILVGDSSGEVIFVNAAYREFTGLDLKDVTDDRWTIIVHPEDREAYYEKYHACVRDHVSFRTEARVRRKDGEWRWIEAHAVPRFSESGEFLGMAGSFPDITERKVAENALAQAHDQLINERNRLLAVMDTLPVGLAILDDKGGVIQANHEYEAVWGGAPPAAKSVEDYAVYKAWWVESGEEVTPEEWAAARAVGFGETVTGQYLRIQRFDGSMGYVLNSGAPIFNASGAVTGGTVAIMDITERVLAEQALVESKRTLQEVQERFRVAVAPAPLLVYTCDRNLRYTWVYNPLRGFRASEMLGKRDDELLPPGAVKELVEAKRAAIETGEPVVQEVRIFMEEDPAYYMLAMEPQRGPDGTVIGLTCSAIDITEQRRMALEREQKTRQIEMQRRLIESRDTERLEIAREIHDGPIQTLVSTIFELQFTHGGVEDPLLKAEIEKLSARMKSAVGELREVVNMLRPSSLIRFGLKRAVEMFADDFRDKHPEIRLALEIGEQERALPEQVSLALFRIYQEALNNIYRHANARHAVVRIALTGGVALMEIADDGVGFVAAPDLSVQTENGHYGMAGMKERAEAAGGTFSVISKQGQGTTIRVLIPV